MFSGPSVPLTGFEPASCGLKVRCPSNLSFRGWRRRRDSNPHRRDSVTVFKTAPIPVMVTSPRAPSRYTAPSSQAYKASASLRMLRERVILLFSMRTLNVGGEGGTRTPTGQHVRNGVANRSNTGYGYFSVCSLSVLLRVLLLKRRVHHLKCQRS